MTQLSSPESPRWSQLLWDSVYKTLKGRRIPDDDIEDIFQETWLRVSPKRNQFATFDDYKKYFVTAAIHQATSTFRSHAREMTAYHAIARQQDIRVMERRLPDDAARLETARRAVLCCLSPDELLAVRQRYATDRKQHQLALERRISPSQMTRILQSARRKIWGTLDTLEYDPADWDDMIQCLALLFSANTESPTTTSDTMLARPVTEHR